MSNNLQENPKSLMELMKILDVDGVKGIARYQEVRDYFDRQAREKGVPIQGSFELTPLCNLDCKMCYVHLHRSQMGSAELLTVADWKHIMGEAIREGLMYAALTGGECLTYPGFRELYEYLGDHGVEIGILSNGVLLDREMISYLKERPPAAIHITLYGASEEAYENVTGKRLFSRVVENIRLLKDAELPIGLSVTPNQFMADGEEIIDLCKELGIRPSVNTGLVYPHKETGRRLYEASLDQYVSILRKNGEVFGRSDERDEAEHRKIDSDLPSKGVTCGAGRSNFHISWRGDMKPCTVFPCKGESVLENGFRVAWKLTRRKAEEFMLPQECIGCKDADDCKSCVAEHAAGAPIGHANPAICAWTHRMKEEGFY